MPPTPMLWYASRPATATGDARSCDAPSPNAPVMPWPQHQAAPAAVSPQLRLSGRGDLLEGQPAGHRDGNAAHVVDRAAVARCAEAPAPGDDWTPAHKRASAPRSIAGRCARRPLATAQRRRHRCHCPVRQTSSGPSTKPGRRRPAHRRAPRPQTDAAQDHRAGLRPGRGFGICRRAGRPGRSRCPSTKACHRPSAAGHALPQAGGQLHEAVSAGHCRGLARTGPLPVSSWPPSPRPRTPGLPVDCKRAAVVHAGRQACEDVSALHPKRLRRAVDIAVHAALGRWALKSTGLVAAPAPAAAVLQHAAVPVAQAVALNRCVVTTGAGWSSC